MLQDHSHALRRGLRRRLGAIRATAALLVLGYAILGSAISAPLASAQLPNALDSARGSITSFISVTPGTVQLPDGSAFEARHPIARALELAGPGCQIDVDPGEYPRLGIGLSNRSWWNARSCVGSPLAPIVLRANGKVVIRHDDAGDTISIDKKQPTGWLRFEGFEIRAGYRAGIFFHDLPDDQSHEGFQFHDCKVLGEWNHLTDSGPHSSKWGVLAHDISDFEFRGVRDRAVVRDIRHEHAFYLQSPRGDITLENIDAERLGRTFCQFTARKRSGPPGRGLITVRGNKVNDVGLARGDAFKGGSAFTFAGRLSGCTIVVADNEYRAGFVPELRKLTTKHAPYGSGALVAWDGGEGEMNGNLVLRGNDFRFAEGCGDRALVSIGACERVSIDSSNTFEAGSEHPALWIDPANPDGSLKNLPNGKISVMRGITLAGDVKVRAKVLKPAEVAELLVSPDSGDPGAGGR